jgi:cytochrome c-type biogenesis protein CcmH
MTKAKHKKTWIAIVMALVFGLIALGGVYAQSSYPTDDEVNAVARDIYCPVCENIPLDVCPTQVCAQWRELIREQLAAGWTEAEIKQYFVDRYGDRVLATPPRTGINWIMYLIPPAAIAVGAVFLFRAFKMWKKPSSEVKPEVIGTDIDDVYLKKIEEELRRR